MFTGIIEEVGRVKDITKDSKSIITIECCLVLKNTKIGDSIAVNGVCLTVVDINSKTFSAAISQETLKVTTLCNLQKNDLVNLERAMPADGRFGGHIVSGHIDSLAKLVNLNKYGEFYELEFEINKEQSKYIVHKGSITINGISLTVANTTKNIFKTAIIPHTYENTNLKMLQKGDIVNIEVDILAKYIEKFLLTSDNKSRITLEFLQENGF